MEIKASKEWFFGDSTPWEELGPGLKRQMMGYDKNLMLIKVAFEEGAVGSTHDHYHSQCTYVVSGEYEMTIGDEVKMIKGGDSYYIPPDVPHGIVCKKKGILIDVFSPAREDFLEGGEVSYFAKK
jgi:quercetin dioxygenase-like cupin family protein